MEQDEAQKRFNKITAGMSKKRKQEVAAFMQDCYDTARKKQREQDAFNLYTALANFFNDASETSDE